MRKLFLQIISLLLPAMLMSQDLHFSESYINPILQNPANTGYFNGDIRATLVHRSQWSSVTVPYNTTSVSTDMHFLKGPGRVDILGIGVIMASDKAGDSHYQNTVFGGSVAYSKAVDRFGGQYFSGGALISYSQTTLDYSSLTFDNQFDGYAFDPLLPTGENLDLAKAAYADFAIGAAMNFLPSRKRNFTIGAAAFHLNEPKFGFINMSSKLPRKYVLHGSSQFHLTKNFELYPKFNVSYQGISLEAVAGTYMRIDLDPTNKSEYAVYVGGWYRYGDAIIVNTRFDFYKMSFGFSYDIVTSKLYKVSNARGGPEVSLIYIGKIPGLPKKIINCPRF